MPKSAKERVYLSRERKKLGLVHLDKWVSKGLWEDIMKLIEGYKGELENASSTNADNNSAN